MLVTPSRTAPIPDAGDARDAEDDELGELPPLDGDLRDAPRAEPEPDADDGVPPEGEASLDDSTGEDEPTDKEEIDLDESDGGWLDEPADAAGLDLGDAPTIDLGAEVAADDDGDEPAMPHEDLGLGFGASPERIGLDAGDEGPVDPDEELRDQDLPALDADEAGDVDEAILIDASFAEGEPHGLPWAGSPWERVGAPLPLVRAVAVACWGRGAVAVGTGEAGASGSSSSSGARTELWRIDLEGASQALPARGLDVAAVRGLEGQAQAVGAWLDSGQRFVSTDGGVTFLAQPAAASRAEATSPPREVRSPVLRAERAGHVAYAALDGGVVRDGVVHAWGGRVTALVFLDDAGRLLAGNYSDADDTTALVHLDVGGAASVVARIGATRADPDSDGQVFSMAHDEARGVVWLAGGFGVAAFAVR